MCEYYYTRNVEKNVKWGKKRKNKIINPKKINCLYILLNLAYLLNKFYKLSKKIKLLIFKVIIFLRKIIIKKDKKSKINNKKTCKYPKVNQYEFNDKYGKI